MSYTQRAKIVAVVIARYGTRIPPFSATRICRKAIVVSVKRAEGQDTRDTFLVQFRTPDHGVTVTIG